MSENTPLIDRIQELIDSGNLTLPVFNKAAARLQALGNSENANVDEVEQLILADQVLVAEVLRAANSPYFGGLSQINTVRSALVRLGSRQVCQLAVLASHRSEFDAKDRSIREMMHTLWSHASATAMAAGWLARRLGFGKQLESEAFLGGLLHDVGKLVILRAIDEIKRSPNPPKDLSPQLLDEILTTAHPAIGHSLLQHWDVPELYCEIARDHHAVDFNPSRIPLVTVRLANYATAKMGLSLRSMPTILLGALPEATSLNASDIVLAELEIMMEDTLIPAGH